MPKPHTQTDKIHERLSSDLPINSVVSVAIVDDPYGEKGEKIQVLRSVRDDVLAGMYAREQIDDAQLAAGRKWQQYRELAEIGSIQAIDPTKEAVDGGKIREPLTDTQIFAFKQLDAAREELGKDGSLLVFDILALRWSIQKAANNRGMWKDIEINYVGRRFRECLESLAKLWGLA
ncbi:MAG: hypothetical protein KGL39_20230 [Patescibacteria group bacterium]|nr:hypothetical protein [Patescibacteria group bacterium]